MWPKQTKVATQFSDIVVIRYEDGSLNIYGEGIDLAISGRQAEMLEDLFGGIAPRSFRGAQQQFALAMELGVGW